MSEVNFDFKRFAFGPAIRLPDNYEVYDFSTGYDPARTLSSPFGIGRYDEKRPGMYTTALFTAEKPSEVRNIHVGVDIAAPAGTEVLAFYEGTVAMAAINSAEGDYGGTIITEHQLAGRTIWALHGHLSHASVTLRPIGAKFDKGAVIAHLGERSENGGWNPHLHFQLSWKKPERCDLPGAVSERDRESALRTYPDPRQVLGPLY